MTFSQEDALYEFLDNAAEPFDLEMVVSFIRMIDSTRTHRLAYEVKELLDFRKLAFSLGNRQWISRRGCFEPIPFVISPTRLELLNGILIPGHRCVPFANPVILPQEYTFLWKGSEIPLTTTEGEPEEFYLFYSIFGEEYAPQYVARENPENETAFNSDPYEDPGEVSIHTLDMRSIYRETSFVPGDRFVVHSLDWKKGIFSMERVEAKAWDPSDLYSWFEAAEGGFEDSFSLLGPGSSTEEQIAFAYWYGGKRMREIPAYSLEEFLYEKTERIETAPFGIETRFWYTGREIPDFKSLDGTQYRPDRTGVETFLAEKKIPISELGLRSYILDFLFRGEIDLSPLIDRIIPPAIKISPEERQCLENYIEEELPELQVDYSPFTDKTIGPIRQRVGELHTAVIELVARLENEKIDPSWLPTHTYIILSQIQSHAAGVMEDMDPYDSPSDTELEAIDNSLDSMIETYEEIKNLIDESLANFRRNRFSLVKTFPAETEDWIIQVSIGGTDVWRRLLLPGNYQLRDLHRIIQNVFGWKNSQIYQFSGEEVLDSQSTIKDLNSRGLVEILYEYGTKWTVKIILLNRNEARNDIRSNMKGETHVRCMAGAGAAPPENIGGPLLFKRFVSALNGGNAEERLRAEEELGKNFCPDAFDLGLCNRALSSGEKILNWPGSGGKEKNE